MLSNARADEVGELHLDHRTQSHQRHAGRHAGKAELGDRRVHHAARSEFGFESAGHLERAAEVAGDVFAEHEDRGSRRISSRSASLIAAM